MICGRRRIICKVTACQDMIRRGNVSSVEHTHIGPASPWLRWRLGAVSATVEALGTVEPDLRSRLGQAQLAPQSWAACSKSRAGRKDTA